VLAVFGKVGARKHPDRRTHPHTYHRHDDGADDGVEQTAFGRAGRRRVLGEKLPAHPGETVIEQREQNEPEPGDAECGGNKAQGADDNVSTAAGSIDRIHDFT
jgi:hypothetical protein